MEIIEPGSPDRIFPAYYWSIIKVTLRPSNTDIYFILLGRKPEIGFIYELSPKSGIKIGVRLVESIQTLWFQILHMG